MQITLTVTAGPHQGQKFSFAEHDTFIVGRSSRARFQLKDKDKYFSRFHFMVEINPPHCRLMDMGSRNGTYVNGQKVATTDLKHGDEIKAGHTFLRVAVSDAVPVPSVSPPTAAPGAPAASSLERPSKVSVPPGAGQRATVPPSSQTLPSQLPEIGTERCRVCGAPAGPRLLCTSCAQQATCHPQPIPGYEMIRELGRGGMGVVYLALRESDGSLTALKTILPTVAGSKMQVERFLREAHSLRDLNHPHIVAFRDMGEAAGLLWFAMDYVKGTDAHAMLKKHGKLPVPFAVNLVCQTLDALAYAHARGLVHRDLKPANLLVTKNDDGTHLVRLADFGLARKYQASQMSGLTMAGALGGTVAFIPPEQILDFRNVQPAADQYSAAATLYNLLTGGFVYDLPRELQKQLVMILQDEPVPILKRRPDIPKDLAAIIERGLAREPGGRYPDVAAMREALRPFAGKE